MNEPPVSDLRELTAKKPKKPIRQSLVFIGLCVGIFIFSLVLKAILTHEGAERASAPTRPPSPIPARGDSSVLARLAKSAAQPEEVNGTPPPVLSMKTETKAADPSDDLLRELRQLGHRIDTLTDAVETLQHQPRDAVPHKEVAVEKKDDTETKRLAAEAKKKAEKLAEEEKAAKQTRWTYERKAGKSSVSMTPSSPYTLASRWDIPCELMKVASSQSPGAMKLWVRQNVYDSATGRYLLIPYGSIADATSEGGNIYGDTEQRMRVTKITFPENRGHIKLNAPVEDVTGRGGLKDQVDNRYGHMALSVVFNSILKIGATAGGMAGMGYGSDGDIGEQLAGTAAQQASMQGQQAVRKQINTTPILTARQGFPCQFSLDEPLVFSRPYVYDQPAIAR